MFKNTTFLMCFFFVVLQVGFSYSQDVDVYPVYTVQVGATNSESDAQGLVLRFQKQRYEAFVLDVMGGKVLWKTIHIGKFLDIDEAKSLMRDFEKSTKMDAFIFQTNSKLYSIFLSRRENAGLEVLESSLLKKEVEKLPDVHKEVQVLVQDESDSQEGENTNQEQVEPIEVSQVQEDLNIQEETQEQLSITSLEAQEEVQEKSERPWYVLASLGVSRVDFSGSDLDQELSNKGYITSSNVDQNSFAWKIVGGYKFSKNLSVEAGYVNLGHHDTEILETDTNTDSFVTDVGNLAPLAIEGGLVEAVGALPIGKRFTLLGKAGGLVWSGESSLVDDNGTDFVLGVGTSYQLSERFAVRAEWERFFLNEDFDLISGGVEASF